MKGVMVAALILAALVACEDATEPAGNQAVPEALRPSFSASCNFQTSMCDKIWNEIQDLQSHEHPICQAYWQQAAQRFNDDHALINNFVRGEMFYFYPDDHEHGGAPNSPGSSGVNPNSSELQGQIAGNEATALGQDQNWAQQNCD